MLVTGAMDSEVRCHDLTRESTECHNCHKDRVKDVEVEAGNPNVFWSASEDGTVRQFDTRLPSGSGHGGGGEGGGNGRVLVDLRHKGSGRPRHAGELKSISLNTGESPSPPLCLYL